MSVRDRKLYDILEVEPTATPQELKKSFLKLSMKWHPDKNPGNPEAEKKYKQITAAYDILKDPEKRDSYDKFGEEGLSGAAGSGFGDIFDIFDIFNNGGRSRRANSPPPKGPDIEQKVIISLEEAYNGCQKKLKVSRQEMCEVCMGKGATKDGAVKKCTQCDGRGVVIQMQRMGPMIQQTQRVCPACNGKCQIIDKEFLCKACGGKKVMNKIFETTIDVSPGVPNNYIISQYGDGHWAPDCRERGDLHVRIIIHDHERFRRFSDNGCDLYMTRTISLIEALCGFALNVKHLDGRMLTLVCAPNTSKDGVNTVINPMNPRRLVEHEGMPVFGRNWEKGDLVVEFEIEFPKAIPLAPHEAISILSKCLPINSGTNGRLEKGLQFKEASQLDSSKNIYPLTTYDERTRKDRERRRQEEGRQASYDRNNQYDDEDMRGQQVTCNSQ